MVAAVTLWAGAGCGDPLPMSQDDLQDYVEQELEDTQDFGSIDSVSCDSGLEASVGTTTNCTLTTSDGTEYPVTVAADKNDDGDAIPSIEYAILTGRAGRP